MKAFEVYTSITPCEWRWAVSSHLNASSLTSAVQDALSRHIIYYSIAPAGKHSHCHWLTRITAHYSKYDVFDA